MRLSKLKIISLSFVIAFITMFFLVGFAGKNTNKIVITGDPEVIEYIETLAYYYTHYVDKSINIDVNAPGSSQAVKDVSEGIADYGVIARNLSTAESNLDGIVTTDTSLATEAFVIIVNKDFNTELIEEMTVDSIGKIFYTDNARWRGVNTLSDYINDSDLTHETQSVTKQKKALRDEAYNDIPVLPVHRTKGDGLRESFEQLAGFETALVGSGKSIDNYADKDTRGVIKDSDGEIIEYVRQNLGAVGYVRYSTYEANKDKVKMLPVTNGAGVIIRELSNQNFQTDSSQYSYPLKRSFRYFYNNNYVSDEAKEFINWITTGHTAKEFEQYLKSGKVTDSTGNINSGTIPLQIGLNDSIVPDYKGSRRKLVEVMLNPILDAAMSAFPYKNSYDEKNEPIRLKISEDMVLPSELNGAKIIYASTDYNILDPSLNGKIVRPKQDSPLNLTVTFTVGVKKDGETKITESSLYVTYTRTVYLLIKGTGV